VYPEKYAGNNRLACLNGTVFGTEGQEIVEWDKEIRA
jgi:hypothetical protein